MKVKSNGSKLPNAWIVSSIDRGRRKIYNDNKIYLKNGEEFEIELYNPTQKNVLALISLDGKPISKSGLVVKSGERFYLDCFLDDLKKFTFDTYDVEDSIEVKEAIAKNGELEVHFYNEEIVDKLDLYKSTNIIIHQHHYNKWYPTYDKIWYDNISYCSNINTSGYNTFTSSTNNNTGLINGSLNNCSTNNVNINNIETGQTSKGEYSSQLFKEIEMEFENNHISNISYKLLPESRIPRTSKDVSDISIEKISNRLSKSEFIQDLISRLNSFNDLMLDKLIEVDEFKLIQRKTIKSIIEISTKTEIDNIDDLSCYISQLGGIMKSNIITEEDFKIIKRNLFNSIK